MRRVRWILFIGVVSVWGNYGIAQQEVAPMLNKGANNAEFLADGYYFSQSKSGSGLEGDIYLNSQWLPGKVLTKDTVLVEAPLRYRVYDDEMQVLVNGQTKALFPEQIRAVSIGERIFVPLEYKASKKKKAFAYFELLVEGDLSLLLRRELEIKPADYNPALNIGSRHDQVITNEVFYYKKEGKLPLSFKQTTKSVLKVLGARKKAVAQFAKENNLTVKSKEDLIKLFQFYNRKG